MHTQALEFYRQQLSRLDPLRVVEFGSLDVNGSVRSVYCQAESWWGVDVVYGPGVNEVADAAHWDTIHRFDVAVCAEVFEHTEDWRDILATAHNVLVPGGLLVASCATEDRPAHSVSGGDLKDGEYYKNVSRSEMVTALKTWTEHTVTVADGHFGNDDLYVTARK